MASTALEKSLDEIIGARPTTDRRGSDRRPRGPRIDSRKTPYAREGGGDRRPRGEDYASRRDRGPGADGSRWSHDRYDEDEEDDHRRSPRRDRSPPRHGGGYRYDHDRNGRDARATRLRVANIHYDLSEGEVRDLFERIAPVARFNMRFDRAGRSEGIAFVTFDRYEDAKAAIAQYDGQSALGQRLEVELDSVVPPPARRDEGRDLASRIRGAGSRDRRDPVEPRRGSRPPRGDRRGGAGGAGAGGRGRGRAEKSGSTARRGPVTADDLDAELDNYINQRSNGDGQKVADTGAEGGDAGGADGMQVD